MFAGCAAAAAPSEEPQHLILATRAQHLDLHLRDDDLPSLAQPLGNTPLTPMRVAGSMALALNASESQLPFNLPGVHEGALRQTADCDQQAGRGVEA